MSIEQNLLLLTPRVETGSGIYNTNLYDDKATLAIMQDATGVHAVTGGALKNVSGTSSGTTFKWTYDFGADSYTKRLDVSSGQGLRIVEPLSATRMRPSTGRSISGWSPGGSFSGFRRPPRKLNLLAHHALLGRRPRQSQVPMWRSLGRQRVWNAHSFVCLVIQLPDSSGISSGS